MMKLCGRVAIRCLRWARSWSRLVKLMPGSCDDEHRFAEHEHEYEHEHEHEHELRQSSENASRQRGRTRVEVLLELRGRVRNWARAELSQEHDRFATCVPGTRLLQTGATLVWRAAAGPVVAVCDGVGPECIAWLSSLSFR